MRKRAQRKGKLTIDEPKHVIQKTRIDNKIFYDKQKLLISLSLIGIFLLILFFNSYFNISSDEPFNLEGEGFDKYYLSGPDPYYNMRIIDETLYGGDAGKYQFYSERDLLLNYPLGASGARPPLFNMMAIGFGRLLSPFMDEVDAVGYSMQFIPALFGALLVFPVYVIGSTIFGKKEGILAALLVAIIPIHLSSGHGSAYTLFDHDSFVLLLFFITFYFLIKSIKERITIKSILYAILGGISLAAVSMTWVEARYLYVIIAIYAIVQMVIDLFTNKIELRIPRSISIMMFTGFLVSLPVLMTRWSVFGFKLELSFFLFLGITIFGILYFIFGKKNIPWTISMPFMGILGGAGLAFLYLIKDSSNNLPIFSQLTKLSDILYGTGIYGNKVSLTIAEAGTYSISRTVMSFGPALYWIAMIGLVFIMYYFIIKSERKEYLFIIVLFITELWLTGVAGRFLNDLVPIIAILGAWVIWLLLDKIDYKKMLRNIKGAGGGLHGIRRGVNFLHIFGILFVAFLIILPNVYLSFDAAIPSTQKSEIFGDLPMGAFGTSLGKEAYWLDALSWLKEQDNEIENSVNRPAFISWWDYGFYEVAIGDHPTVADNFQSGIPPAANFHTATSENEAVIVWIVRLLEGNARENKGLLTNEVVQALVNNVGLNNTNNITKWVENPETSPSYNTQIGLEYDEELGKDYPVGQQWPMNAVYHDVVDLLSYLNDEEITSFYKDIQEATGKSIRYYGVEGYDKQIFNIFGFLGDKSLLLVSGGGNYNPEDDFVYVKYITQNNNELSFEELNALSDEQLRQDPPIQTKQYYKDAYFDTMFYRTYVGISTGEPGSKTEPTIQIPCYNMKHFYAEYISPPQYMYYQGQGAVVIAKYYAGAFVNGRVTFDEEPVDVQVVVQKNVTQYETELPIDHDNNITINGNFSVIVPAGNITIQLRRNPELGDRSFILKNVTFNGAEDTEIAPIKEAEAMRNVEDYNRSVNISIEPASINGYVYNDNNNNDVYNLTIDDPLKDINVEIVEINEFDTETFQPIQLGGFRTLETDENGYYNTSDLMPGYYFVLAEVDDFIIHENFVMVYSGVNNYNISKPKNGDIDGVIYFDENSNGAYDSGEILDNVDVELLYTRHGEVESVFVDSLRTDETGRYNFDSLIPGPYEIHAYKLPDYETYIDVTINENESTSFNVSIEYANINLNGYTLYDVNKISNVTISLQLDNSVENNTAEQSLVLSDTSGFYSAYIKPGFYNISISQVINEEGINVTYNFDDQLEVKIGEVMKSYDIKMTKSVN